MRANRATRLFAVLQETPGTAVAFLRLCGRRVVDLGETDAAALATLPATRLRAAFFSPQSHLERHAFTLANKRLLPLRVQRHIEDESLFPGAFRARHRVSVAVGAGVCADVVAVPEEHISRVEASLPLRARPVEALVSVENALAALLARVTAEPVVVVWVQHGVLVALLVQGGGVLIRRMERLAGDAAGLHQEQAKLLADAVAAAGRRMLQRDVGPVVVLGEARDWCGDCQADPPVLESKLEGLFDAAPGDVLRHAALFGLAFSDPAVNLLQADYRHAVRAHRLARPLAVLALAVGITAGGAGVVALSRASALEQDLAPRRAAMEQRAADAAARRPSAAQLEVLRTWADVGGDHALRLDRFMPWLSRAVPAGVRFVSVSVKPLASPSRGRRPAQAAARQYQVELVAESAGDYETTRRLSAVFLRNLGGTLRLGKTAFRYESAGKAVTHIIAVVQGEDY